MTLKSGDSDSLSLRRGEQESLLKMNNIRGEVKKENTCNAPSKPVVNFSNTIL
jgi:hypothetical protein